MEAASCQPQSQRREPKTSPVRHRECMRTRTLSLPFTSPNTSATCSRSSTSFRYPTIRNSPCGVGSLAWAPGASGRQGETYQPPPVLHHEIDHVGRHQLGSAHQVALALAVFVIRDDDQPAGVAVSKGLLYCTGR